jgi:hypothetical protein
MSQSAINRQLIINAAKSADGLLALLGQGLDWPIPDDLESIPLIGWKPEELHLDPTQIGTLTSIKQIPRLNGAQPFGVFVLNFEGGRLPEGAVRRVVNRLIRRKRAAAKGSQKGLWDLSDLIFFCQSRHGGGTVHVVAFSDGGPRPVMRVISWDAQPTDARLDLLSMQTLPDLVWPSASIDVEEWRLSWSHAFQTSYRQGVRNASELAKAMATVARAVRDRVLDMLPAETDDGPLRGIFRDVKRSLIADLDFDSFADMYAQTMVYGLLTARITHPEAFVEEAKRAVLEFENPFLDAIYSRMKGEAEESFDTDELGLQDLADLLAKSDMTEVLADFGAASRRDDPVVHFYEDFLKEYDPAQQIELGVYYTPQPVVSYQIRTIDKTLKEQFGLPLGVADPTTWTEYCDAHGMPVPDGVNPAAPFVFMLDPATGTGTYLVEWLRQAERNIKEYARLQGLKGKAIQDAWSTALEDYILSQMSAFEISLASYTVAHLKVALEIPDEVRSHARIPIYLTDTLAAPHGTGQLALEPDPMSEESALADRIKLSRAVTVVVGNPPYRERAMGSGGIVEQQSSNLSTPSLDAFREPGNGRLEYKLHNLNIYFWRWATWKALDQHDGAGGIASFITTSPYLSGGSFAGMRRYLRGRGTTLQLVDCTPEGHQPEVPTRLFPGVQQPLAIMTVARAPETAQDFIYAQVHGNRAKKFEALSGVAPLSWLSILGSGTAPLTAQDADWLAFPAMPDLLPDCLPGVKTNRSWVIAPSRQILRARWNAIKGARLSDLNALMKATSDRDSSKTPPPLPGYVARASLGKDRDQIESPIRFAYRAFDRQYLIPDGRLVDRPRPDLWVSQSDTQIYITELHTEPLREGPGLLFTTTPTENSYFKGSGGGRVFPIWRSTEADSANVAPGLLGRWSETLGRTTSMEVLVDYLAGIAGTASYQRTFQADLQTPGVRIPISEVPELVDAAMRLGSAVLWLHTFGARGTPVTDAFPGVLTQLPSLVSTPKGTVTSMPVGFSFDESSGSITFGDGLIEGVSPEVANYTTSGMPVLRKWFAYRKPQPAGRSSGALSELNDHKWRDEWTSDLIEILTSLTWLVALEPQAAELIDQVLNDQLLPAE